MKNAGILLGIMMFLGCTSLGNRGSFLGSLECGLTVDQVRALAEDQDAKRFTCSRPGGPRLHCVAAWGTKGIDCAFDKSDRLQSCEHYKAGPLTKITVLETRSLCSSRGDDQQQE